MLFECNWYNVSELWPSNYQEWLKTAWAIKITKGEKKK